MTMNMYIPNKNKVILIYRYWDKVFFGLLDKSGIDYIKGDTLKDCILALNLIETGHVGVEVLEICNKKE